jgi:hypothetical protein
MFDNLAQGSGYSGPITKRPPQNNKMQILLFAVLGGVLVIGIMVGFIKSYLGNPKKPSSTTPTATTTPVQPNSTSTGTGLPENGQASSSDPYGWSGDFSNVKAETLIFSDYYEAPKDKVEIKADAIKLPLSVKVDAANYYDFSRKVELTDKQIEELNRNGFTVMDNIFKREANDFYGLHNLISKKDMPQFISSDFIWYFYQNQMKEVFTDIKVGTFYKDLWKINKDFFQIANARYKKTKAKVGTANDPVLEAERLEAAFFAVGLELLKPKAGQISSEELTTGNKFSASEKDDYFFELPDYLASDVSKELSLINKAATTDKSPVLLYERDYNEFDMTAESQGNAKLANFYLAHRWFNSVFPLYYRDDKCKDCLLDQNDWLINFIANAFIAKDFSDNQELKNRWARIYKVVSYFSGLRKDLTYLHYNEVMLNLFGDGYDPEQIFSIVPERQRAEQAARKVQDEIAKRSDYYGLEGSYDRADQKTKPILGMRLLQTDYWPDHFIFNRLTNPNVSKFLPAEKNRIAKNVTACPNLSKDKGELGEMRCAGIGLDIINILKPVASNPYFNENTSYRDYTKQSDILKNQLLNFSANSWHASQYWSTLDVIRKSALEPLQLKGPIITDTADWRNRQTTSALAAWVNLRLPADKWIPNLENVSGGDLAESAYMVEPAPVLVDELLANARMLGKMMGALHLVKDVDLTGKKLAEVQDELLKLKAIIRKELAGENLDNNDLANLANFARKHSVSKAGEKRTVFSFERLKTVEDISNLKLIIIVEQVRGKSYLAIGPIYDLQEGGR